MAQLHLICGLPGAGKTTLARKLAQELPALRLCPDEWILPLMSNPDDRKESERLREVVEKQQKDLALQLLALGTHVILENGFWSREEREQYRLAGVRAGARVFLHYLAPPLDELWRRLESRNSSQPAAAFRVSRAELHEWAGWFEAPDLNERALYACEGDDG